MVISGEASSMQSAPPPPHVALFAFPFGSHVAPLYSLAQALAAAAPAVIFSFVSTSKTLKTLQRPAANLRLCPFEEDFTDEGSSVGLTDVVERFLEVSPGKVRVAAKTAATDAGGIPVSCVVSDAFMWMAVFVAEDLGVPWITVFPGFPLALLAHIRTDDLRCRFGSEEKVLPLHADTLLDFIPGLATMRVRDLPEGIIFGDSNSKFALNIHSMTQRLPQASAIIFHSFSGLELDSSFFCPLNLMLPIGPPNLLSPPPPIPDKEGCLPWLDSHAPTSVVYIAFGTIWALPPAELAELAHGLEHCGVPFLWSLKEEARSNLPEGFMERMQVRGKLVNWAPQASVLSHAAVGAFVTHCGWNSTLESLSAGVVTLCRPIFAEQKMVARAAESILGVGLNLGMGITREVFVGAVDAVLRGDHGKKLRKRAAELRERTKKAVLPGGIFSENFNVLVELVSRR